MSIAIEFQFLRIDQINPIICMFLVKTVMSIQCYNTANYILVL